MQSRPQCIGFFISLDLAPIRSIPYYQNTGMSWKSKKKEEWRGKLIMGKVTAWKRILKTPKSQKMKMGIQRLLRGQIKVNLLTWSKFGLKFPFSYGNQLPLQRYMYACYKRKNSTQMRLKVLICTVSQPKFIEKLSKKQQK